MATWDQTDDAWSNANRWLNRVVSDNAGGGFVAALPGGYVTPGASPTLTEYDQGGAAVAGRAG